MTTRSTTARPNIDTLTFGVEIETHIPNTSPIRIGGYNRGRFNQNLLPGSWTVSYDGSIRTPNGRRRGAEFVSPVLRGTDGMQNLVNMVNVLKAQTTDRVETSEGTFDGVNARVNASCGIHVHVGFPSHDLKVLQRLVTLVAAHEDALFASTGTKNRERGHWCKPIKTSFQNVPFAEATRAADLRYGRVADRYHGLNLVNIITGRRPTVEFRIFSGSLNPTKIAAYVQLCLGLVQLALTQKRAGKWQVKEAGERFGKNAGAGTRKLNRLMSRLNWINPKSPPYGVLLGDDLPTIRGMKSALRKMTRKYDAAP